MKKYRDHLWISAICVLFLFTSGMFLFANEKPSEEDMKGPVIVASKIDTEGALLGQMIIHMLEANGFDAVDKTEFGPTDVIRKAIINGEIDIYPEYTGNGGFFFDNTQPSIWACHYFVSIDCRSRYYTSNTLLLISIPGSLQILHRVFPMDRPPGSVHYMRAAHRRR